MVAHYPLNRRCCTGFISLQKVAFDTFLMVFLLDSTLARNILVLVKLNGCIVIRKSLGFFLCVCVSNVQSTVHILCSQFQQCVSVVIRLEAKSEKFDMFMHLDVMVTKDFLVKEGDKFAMVLAPTLNLDGTPDTGYYTPVIIFLL